MINDQVPMWHFFQMSGIESELEVIIGYTGIYYLPNTSNTFTLYLKEDSLFFKYFSILAIVL